jgi:pyruvate formate lyase activating enzyme
VLFTAGCNFRCPYCHNGSLVRAEAPQISWDCVWDFLRKRSRVLGGITVSGGEPLLHAWIPDFLRQARALGYKTKLDTNGSRPEALAAIIAEGLLDYVAMDVKSSPQRYSHACGLTVVDLDQVLRSAGHLRSSGIAYEFRTTICNELTDLRDVRDIAVFLGGGARYILQPVSTSNQTLSGQIFTPPSPHDLKQMSAVLAGYFDEVRIRGA